MPCVCLANYGASEAFYPCIVGEKIHEYFRSKMRQLENKISCSLTLLELALFRDLYNLSYIYLGSSVCHIPVIFLSVVVAERSSILLVFIIKLTKDEMEGL